MLSSFGIDTDVQLPDGHWETEERQGVVVPENSGEEIHRLQTVLRESLDPLSDDESYGASIYVRAKAFV